MGTFDKKDERKKAREAIQARGISRPINPSTSTMVDDTENIANFNNHAQQQARNPHATLNDIGHSSTPGHSTSHGHPNRAPQGPSRSVTNNPHQSNQAPPRPARHQQPAMNTSSAGQSSPTGRPRSQGHIRSTRGNSGRSNSSRPSSAHSGAPSVTASPNNTAATSQRNSRASYDSHSSSMYSSDIDPFYFDSPEWRDKHLRKEGPQ
ncbi:hypothetical protein EAE96_003975 [Botrytis aclada]|nr:hypothetical protein EAE96_003975 [Botrytis aclada]